MPAKPNSRNWNDVQTAIATAAIVTTLGLWNLFATPAKAVIAQAEEPALPPTEPPVAAAQPAAAAIPQVKIMFTQVAPITVSAQQSQQQPQMKKKKKGNGGGQSVTVTKSS
jgi:hypothetical protein